MGAPAIEVFSSRSSCPSLLIKTLLPLPFDFALPSYYARVILTVVVSEVAIHPFASIDPFEFFFFPHRPQVLPP